MHDGSSVYLGSSEVNIQNPTITTTYGILVSLCSSVTEHCFRVQRSLKLSQWQE